MTQEWDVNNVKWPSRWPWAMTAALVVGIAAFMGAGVWQYKRAWTPFERLYLGVYAKTHLPSLSLFQQPTATFNLLYRVDAKGRRLATSKDLGDVVDHKARMEWGWEEYDKLELRTWLRNVFYGGRSPWQKFADQWWIGVLVFGLALLWAVPKDYERWRPLRKGLRLRGPEMVTTSAFNKRNRSTGIGFVNLLRVWWDQLLFPNKIRMVHIPLEREAKHVLLMGDSGTGKTTLIKLLLLQIQARGQTAIVYDPAREYTECFYDPERGDVILNPLDERMPYWSPSDEVGHAAEAATVATSLFPDDHRDNPFFVEGPRKVFAHLLSFRPTPQDLVAWMSNAEEIDRRVKGTPWASMVHEGAHGQRGGMLGTLSKIADSMALLPKREQTQSTWSAAQWAKQKRGWIFITSRPEHRDALKPLISLWLDMLVLRLMNDVDGAQPATWFVLDELASLQRLPQLLTAVTENRKSGNPVVLGFQGKSQLEKLYGQDAATLLSQPSTKVYLRTSEPGSAEWIAKAIGEADMLYRRKGRSADEFPNRRASQSEQDDRRMTPLVTQSEVGGLDDCEGYLKSINLVVHLRFQPFGMEKVQEGFIPREMAVTPERPILVPAAPVPPAPAPVVPAQEEEPAFFE